MEPLFFPNSGPRQNVSPGSLDEILHAFTYLGSTVANSPEQLPQPLPGPDPPSFLLDQPSSPTFLPTDETRYPASFVVGSTNPIAHTSFDHHGRPLRPNLQPIPYPGPATLRAGRPLVRRDLQGYSPWVANGSSPVHDFPQYPPTGPTYGQPPHMFVSQHETFHPAMGIPHGQMQLAPAGVGQSSSSIPSDWAPQPPPTRHPTWTSSFPIQSVSPKEMVLPTSQWVRDDGMRAPPSRPFIPPDPARQPPPTRRNSRGSGSFISSPYSPTRTSSVPVQSVPPKVMTLHTCQWVRDDGMPCRTQITRADLPQHLATTHSVKNIAHNQLLSCGWSGCRLRGDKAEMNRESILRHVREKHMGYRRASK